MKQNNKRIGVFQADWPFQVHTFNLVCALSQSGYKIDLFLHNSKDYVGVDLLSDNKNIFLYISPSKQEIAGSIKTYLRNWYSKSGIQKKQLFRKIFSLYHKIISLPFKIKNIYWFINKSEKGILPKGTLSDSIEIIIKRKYDCLIGIEKNGLIWAGKIAEKLNIPLIYYSLELYTDEYYEYFKSKTFYIKRIRYFEAKYHKKSVATIIQDRNRAEALFKGNKTELSEDKIAYLPISLMGPTYKKSSSFLCQLFKEKVDKKRIILYFGIITENRFCYELSMISRHFQEDWILILHGEIDPKIYDKIQKINIDCSSPKILISSSLVPYNQIEDLVASADIGLVFYSPELLNDRFTIFSSEKIALYFKCGVPIIGFNYEGYKELIENEQCGATIEKIEEIPDAIRKILSSYPAFKKNAYRVFKDYYQYERNFVNVIRCVEGIS
jgi:glycosyltransferase involved in cell wall biosynthesis